MTADARLSVETEDGVPVPEIETQGGETIEPDAVEAVTEPTPAEEGEERPG